MPHNLISFRKVHDYDRGRRKIYISGMPTDEGLRILKQSGVKHILSAAPDERQRKIWESSGGTYHDVNLMRINEESERVERGVAVADAWKKGEGNLLVHCDEGLGRSPIMAYVVLRRLGVPHSEALRKCLPTMAMSRVPITQEYFEPFVAGINKIGKDKGYWN